MFPGSRVDERDKAAGSEFFAAIREAREPNSRVAHVLPRYQVLHGLEQQLAAG
jgi:hypothetical protein